MEEFKKSEASLREEETLKQWNDRDIFNKTLAKESPEGEFVFYEGPPTANGHPGIHHMIPRVFKDAIPRYKTMRGFHVRRKAGWDTHGLPVEIETEKQLGLTSKKQIEEYGIEAFNEKCKESVWQYIDEWRMFTERMGYWVNLDDAYVTYYPQFMESVWNVIKTASDGGYLYKDYKVVPWCPRCGSALSSHEVAQGYADVEDTSVYIKFKATDAENEYFLAWTTTPWTLPGNVALAVGEDMDYVQVEHGGDLLWLAEARLHVLGQDTTVLQKVPGKELIGRTYEPLFPYLKKSLPASEQGKMPNVFKIHPAKFVSTGDGTGIVHTAVMYGAEDFELGNEIGLPKHHLVAEDGTFTKDVTEYAGEFVKDDAVQERIIADLDARGLLLRTEKITHTYPFCWRCKTPLIYYARTSWYIRMSALRDKLVKENEKINWVPDHIKEGRFGEWLREIKDWAISRDRYWGTPLPVWTCAHCHHQEVVESVEKLTKLQRQSGNTYTVLRHGEAESNRQDIYVSSPGGPLDVLTEKGKEEVEHAAKKLKKTDLIITSPFNRTKETAAIVAQHLGLSPEQILIDDRLGELHVGALDGKTFHEAAAFYMDRDWFTKKPEGGESHQDVKRRVTEFLYDIDATYEGKHILLVTHGGAAQMLFAAAEHATEATIAKDMRRFNETAEFHELPFTPVPHNRAFELDLHKPFIDEVVVPCPKCEAPMKREPEVLDVWFDSGSMPFAQDHYPFENKDLIDDGGYPAQFISEAIDQTRGWFYTLHAVGVLMGKGRAYENVICLGHILDAKGKKMSKSWGNAVNPWEMMAKYGVDPIRFWMYSINQPGDTKNFDEKTVDEVVKKVFTILRNVLKFYTLYAADLTTGKDEKSSHVLDQWILARFAELSRTVTEGLEGYNPFEPTRAIRDFVNDLSTWYVRRSRDRFKSDDTADKTAALRTTRFVLLELSKLLAPFTPFFAEEIYAGAGGELESVHLENWPEAQKVNADALLDMEEVRRVVSLALEARMNAGIKIRQPLAKLTIRKKHSRLKGNDALLAIIKDELNVKDVVWGEDEGWEVELDTVITPELEKEGRMRELVRAIQEFRKQSGLQPGDTPAISVTTNTEGVALVTSMKDAIVKATNLSDISAAEGDTGGEDYQFTLG